MTVTIRFKPWNLLGLLLLFLCTFAFAGSVMEGWWGAAYANLFGSAAILSNFATPGIASTDEATN